MLPAISAPSNCRAAKRPAASGAPSARLGNAFVVLIGELDKSAGASTNAAKNIDAVASAIQKIPGYIAAAAGGFGTLQTWLNQVGNHPIFDKINKFFGADTAGNQARLDAMLGQGSGAPATTPSAPSTPSVTPVSTSQFPVPGKDSGKSDRKLRVKIKLVKWKRLKAP